ncbi:Zinc finger protein CONSTANS-LIKE 8 [Hirschfeldia incana]|nr:Zinc finger protein CONSTANS-LIKE 8 [Hirschfeldia incana]
MIPEHQEYVKRPRDCELCLNKHAVWYCASDDAFLCHVCDESVHRANQVATKHERVCLKTNEISSDVLQGTTRKPVWQSWFRRKARTPRVRCEKKLQEKVDDEKRREDPRVPEIGSGETNEDDEDLTSLVPEFQGFVEMELFLSNHDGSEETMRQFNVDHETDAMEDLCYIEEGGKRNGDEVCHVQSLMSCKNEHDVNHTLVITKTEENAKQRNILLRLNYENVIAAWDKQESLTTATWNQNEFNTASNFQLVPPGIEEKKVSNRSEREARVWRYRDKRKNRLFEKKIRYEVRKVNADKRPRMKGRFVRRSFTNDS